MSIAGQWIGAFQGTNTGEVLVNIDRRPGGFSGSAAVSDANPALPSATYNVTLLPAGSPSEFTGHADLRNYYLVVEGRWTLLPRESIQDRFPDILAEAKHIEFSAHVENDSLAIHFLSDAETNGLAELQRTPVVGQNSTVTAEPISWGEFKNRIVQLAEAGQIFRGQANPLPLQTSFHRTQRFDLNRFSIEDIHDLRRSIASQTNTFPNAGDPEMLATLLGIGQHHGFPTPLLDWTESPYVAAYFAIRDAIHRVDAKPTVFCFHRRLWTEHHPTATDIGEPLPVLAFLKPTPWQNPRLLPQQSILMFCNSPNLENFVAQRAAQTGHSFMTAFEFTDSPRNILRDLRMMGVHAPSLFPGLDGACRGVYEASIEA